VGALTAADRRQALYDQISDAQLALRRAAAAAALKNDPLSQHLNALALSVSALGDICRATEIAHIEIAQTFKSQTDIVAQEAIAKVHASGMAIMQELAPKLADAAEWTMRQNFKTLRLRTVTGLALSLVAAILIPCAFTYAAGLNAGRFQGEVAAHVIQSALTAGPEAAMDWEQLMTDNDPVAAMVACRKNATIDAEGHRYCAMPIWLDQPQQHAPQ
jgi:hypothetical protein